MTENQFLEGLTDSQRQAVTHIEGPALILAGPGSGKTRVITHRIGYMIQQGISPYQILAITFTNKAAQEMRNRLNNMGIARGSTICTFHSLAARLLREFAGQADLSPDFSIYDDSDQKSAMKEVLKVLELDPQNFKPASLLNRISKYKNDLKTPEMIVQENEFDFLSKRMRNIYRVYQEQLEKNAALDFDDLLMKLAYLLRDDKQLRDQLNQRYQYVLVDEYQDTNHCQYQIAKGLALNHRNLLVTGDPDQSIYGWRGADIGNILAFEEDYPEAITVRLEENFRSIPEVLSLADDVIRANKQRKQKALFTSKPSGQVPQIFSYYNEYEEAEGLAQWVKQLHQQGTEYRDIAVFYRINSMSRVLEDALRKSYIPYQIVRGLEFYKRKEVKDMLSYLRLLVNPTDAVSLTRIINCPARGIGKTTVERLLDYSRQNNLDIWTVLNRADEISTLNTAAKTKLRKFVDLVISMQGFLAESVEQVMKQVYELSGLQRSLLGDKDENARNNIEEMINAAQQFDMETENPTLADYLQQIALVSDADGYDENASMVSLMTLHAAKGLEFPAVRIVGVEDGVLPHSRHGEDEAEREEERRLLFVGITRAQQVLTMSFSHNRTVFGQSQATISSPFVRDAANLEWIQQESAASFGESSGSSSDNFTVDADDDYIYTDVQDEQDDLGIYDGQLVRHPTLGIGQIKKVYRQGEKSSVLLKLKNGQVKRIYLQYVNLVPME